MPTLIVFAGLITCSLFWGVPTIFCGDSPSFVFKRNQSAILSQQRSMFEGYVFAAGTAQALKPNPSSLDRARQKARLKAQGNLVGPSIVDRSDWPESIRETGVGERIAKRFTQSKTRTIKAEHLQSVYDTCHEQECLSVVAVPLTGIESRTQTTWGSVIQMLDRDFAQGFYPVSLYDYLEVCDDSLVGDVLLVLETQIKDKYGVFVADVVGGRPVGGIPVLWGQGKRLPPEKVERLDTDGLLQLLNLDPYDPVVLYFLAKSFEAQGRNRFASLLYARGINWLIDPEYNLLCLEAAGKERSLLEEAQRDDIVASFKSSVEIPSGIATLVIQSFGTLPLADTDSNLDLSAIDLASIGRLVARQPTAKTFAAVAEFFLERGEVFMALLFGRQAASMSDRFTGLKAMLEAQAGEL